MLFLHFVALLFAALPGSYVLLPFEANFGLYVFRLLALAGRSGFMKGALVRSLVAQVESEFPIVYDLASGVVEVGFFEPPARCRSQWCSAIAWTSASSVGVVGWCSCCNSARSC